MTCLGALVKICILSLALINSIPVVIIIKSELKTKRKKLEIIKNYQSRTTV